MQKSHRSTRRDFMLHTMVGSVFCSVLPRWQGVLGAIQRPDAKYDLVVKGGRVVDPSQSLSAARDVGIIGNKSGAELRSDDDTRKTVGEEASKLADNIDSLFN